MNNRLNKTEIEKYLKYNIKVITVNETSSTNDDLKKLAQEGKNTPVLLCANKQLKGRGRLGNSFFSPENGIYMSLLFFTEQFKDESLFITTMAACSVSSAIEKTTDKTTKIKWVNDIYTDNGKVCGILTESSFDAEKNVIDYFVLGVGVNLFSPIDGFPDELKGIASSLYEENSVYIDIKNKLIAEITNGFLDSLFSFNKEKHINEYAVTFTCSFCMKIQHLLKFRWRFGDIVSFKCSCKNECLSHKNHSVGKLKSCFPN